jgi:hypothetical protein
VWKDLLKLQNPKEGNSECLRYFLWLFKSMDSGTEKSVNDKIVGFGKMDCVVRCRCYALSDLKGDKFPKPFYKYPEGSNK